MNNIDITIGILVFLFIGVYSFLNDIDITIGILVILFIGVYYFLITLILSLINERLKEKEMNTQLNKQEDKNGNTK